VRDEPQPRWWQTVPGVLTAIVGTIAAIAGLILNSHQSVRVDTTPQPDFAVSPAAAALPAASNQTRDEPVERVVPTEIRFRSVAFRILAIQLNRRDAEHAVLKFTIRRKTSDTYDPNTWDNSFRLVANGVPFAPISDAHNQNAEEGNVVFAIPSATRAVVLRIQAGDEVTDTPIDLAHLKTAS